MKTNTPIEPGLIALFRLTVGLWLAMHALAFIVHSTIAPMKIRFEPPPWIILNAFVAVFLLFYLSSRRLMDRLGWWYLPVGLMISTVGPMIEQWLNLSSILGHASPADFTFVMERSIDILFFPLLFTIVVISVQYNLKTVLAYALGTAILEVVLILSVFAVSAADIAISDYSINLAIRSIVKRTMLLALTGFLIARIIQGQKTDRKALGEKNVKLAQYATTVEQLAISHERNRMARDLHDTLAHTLSAVSVQLQALNTQFDSDAEGARQTLKNTTSLTRDGLKEVRRALIALRASPLEDLGLKLALRHLLETSAVRAGINIEFDIADELDRLPPETEQSFYRIAEEAVNNAIRHADAGSISVSLSQDKGARQLEIIDDGIGFDADTDPAEGHFGIRGMQERAVLCNGQLEIESRPGAGTTVKFIARG